MDSIALDDLYKEKPVVLQRINNHFSTERMGYLKVPTGWGKTFLAKHLMRQYYEEAKVILFLVSKNNPLLVQTFYRDRGMSLPLFPDSLLLAGRPKPPVTVAELERRIRTRKGGLVVFASLQTLISKGNREVSNILSEQADLVIIDEVHNFIFNKGNEFIDSISEDAKVLGMTATPFQGVVGSVKFVEDISSEMREVFSKTLPQCIMDEDLCELSYTIIRSNLSLKDLFEVKKLSDLNHAELCLDCGSPEKIKSIAHRTYLAKRVYDDRIDKEKPGKKPKTLIFCAPVSNIVYRTGEDERKVPAFHAKLCSAIFNGELEDRFDPKVSFDNRLDSGRFKDAVYLSSDRPKNEQSEILEAFRRIGEPPYTLCTIGMLIEGFDFPDLENLILLRPTLSMRLFEQQVGRVTRKPQDSDKGRGNIIEVSDDIDSLYDDFGDEVFNEKVIERIQMLRPENRIEEWFTEGGSTEALDKRKIEVTQIDFGGSVDTFLKSSVQIPPMSLRARYFSKVLSLIERRTEGALSKEGERVMEMAIGFKVNSINDAKEIARLADLLEQLERDAIRDGEKTEGEKGRLSNNCRREKPRVFKEARWLLLLRALTSIEYYSKDLNDREKDEIIGILGLDGKSEDIGRLRLTCLKNGSNFNDPVDLYKEIKRIEDAVKMFSALPASSKKHLSPSVKRFLGSAIYWASCFIPDHTEIRDLFESREWNHRVRRYLITAK